MHRKCALRDTVEFKEHGGKGREKKGSREFQFLVRVHFKNNAKEKKRILEIKKKHRAQKTFYFISKYFFLIDKRNQRII